MSPSSPLRSQSGKQWTSMSFAPTRLSKTGYKTMAQRDAAVDTLGPLLDERTRLIIEVVRTVNNTATNSSSGEADPVYDALAAAHQHAKTR